MADLKKYFSGILTLSIPLIVGNIAHMLIGAVDVLVASRHGTDTLAAISISNAILVSLFIIGIGLMAGITPVVSNYLGEGQQSKKYLLSTINYAMLLAAIFMVIGIGIIPFLDKFGFEDALLPIMKQYIFIVSFSNFGGYLHFSLKEFLQAYEITVFPNVLQVLSIFLNLIFNIIFVFGFWKIPAMGAIGLAVATLLVRTLIGLVLFIYCYKFVDYKFKFEKSYIGQLIKVGYPIAFAMMFEFLGFNVITILTGRISSLYAAAQSILITITSLIYMVPLAVSNAIAIKVGYANGAKNYSDIKNYSFAGSAISFLFMFAAAFILYAFPKFILGIFTPDEKLIEIGTSIIALAALYQVLDGLQVSFSGVLKGLKRTLFVTGAIVLGYWFIGLPIGALFAYKYGMGLFGFWVGIALAILTMCIFMGAAIVCIFKRLRKEYS
ncbi:MAG: MATE family efflux transporter [bacterium]|nr:MATE family efflux transporter [bacterium]